VIDSFADPRILTKLSRLFHKLEGIFGKSRLATSQFELCKALNYY